MLKFSVNCYNTRICRVLIFLRDSLTVYLNFSILELQNFSISIAVKTLLANTRSLGLMLTSFLMYST